MTRDERRFFNDVKNAVSDYDCSFQTYYAEDGQFCVDVTVDLDQWGGHCDEIWEALCDGLVAIFGLISFHPTACSNYVDG